MVFFVSHLSQNLALEKILVSSFSGAGFPTSGILKTRNRFLNLDNPRFASFQPPETQRKPFSHQYVLLPESH